jgi:capsular exopolysaccharide synthesis family protein
MGNVASSLRAAKNPAVAKSSILDLHRLMEIVRRRYRLIVGIAILVLAAIVAAMFLVTPQYSSEALLKVEPVAQRRSDLGASNDSTQPDSALVDTEVAIIRSREVIDAVVKQLNLSADPEFSHGEIAQLAPDAKLEKVGNEISEKLGVARQGLTYIIAVSFQSKDSEKAARIANAVAQQYLKVSRELRGGAAEERADALKGQVAALGLEVQEADAKIARFRAATGTVSGGETIGTATDRLVLGIAQELSAAESAAAEARSRAAIARTQVSRTSSDSVSQVLSSSTINDLRRQQAALLQQRADAAAQLGASHPTMARINDQLDSVNAELKIQSSRIVAGLDADATAATSRANNLQQQLGRLRGVQGADATALASVETMQRQADGARAVYNQLNQAMQEAKEQAQVSGAQARIVSRATVPVTPSFPNKPLFLAFGIVLATTAGLGGALAAEGMRRGFRSSTEVEDALNVEVLGSLVELDQQRLKNAGVEGEQAHNYVLARPNSVYAETLRGIRSEMASREAGGQVLTVTSAMMAEGKTTTAISLARIMAASGDSVIIVDGDLRRRSLSSTLVPDSSTSLLDVLTGNMPVEDAVIKFAERLDVLPVQAHEFIAKDSFGSGVMDVLLEHLKTQYDWVVVDAPPILSVTDARQLTRMSDRVLIVIRWEHTPSDAVRKALERTGRSTSGAIGLVLNRVRNQKNLSAIDPAYYGYAEEYYEN